MDSNFRFRAGGDTPGVTFPLSLLRICRRAFRIASATVADPRSEEKCYFRSTISIQFGCVPIG